MLRIESPPSSKKFSLLPTRFTPSTSLHTPLLPALFPALSSPTPPDPPSRSPSAAAFPQTPTLPAPCTPAASPLHNLLTPPRSTPLPFLRSPPPHHSSTIPASRCRPPVACLLLLSFLPPAPPCPRIHPAPPSLPPLAPLPHAPVAPSQSLPTQSDTPASSPDHPLAPETQCFHLPAIAHGLHSGTADFPLSRCTDPAQTAPPSSPPG